MKAKLHASLEYLLVADGVSVGVVRVHALEGHHGDKYIWTCAFRIVLATAELYGAMRALKPSEYRAVRAALWDAGVRHVIYERKNTKHDREILVEI